MPCVLRRFVVALLALPPILLSGAPASSQTLQLSIAAEGIPPQRQVLPPGATARLKVVVGNRDSGETGPIKLTAEPAGLVLVASDGWRGEAGNAVVEIARLKPGERVERILQLKVERAPTEAEAKIIRITARGASEQTASAEIKLMVADCVGAYRDRLAALRSSLSQQVRDAADEMRKPDPALPASRLFAFTNARNAEIRTAERLAASFSARRGGDAEMATEWFRYIITRWVSELNAFAGQAYNPGLCADNYYQIAGYRQGLLPITTRIDTIHASALAALAAAREAAGAEPAEELMALAMRVARNGDAESSGPQGNAFNVLGEARATFLRERKLSQEEVQRLSLIETAAWLEAADRRGQKLAQGIEQVLSTLASAQKESCICSQ